MRTIEQKTSVIGVSAQGHMNTQDKLFQLVENSRSFLNSLSGIHFIKDAQSNYIECSPAFEQELKVSRKNVIGYTDFNLPWARLTELYQKHDRDAMQKNKSEVLEPVQIDQSMTISSRTLKLPITDSSGEVIGIFGQMDVLAVNNNLNEALSTLIFCDKIKVAHTNHLLKNYRLDHYDKNLKLTQRETECLFLLIRGKSAKEIARFLKISPRTVEVYIENIKLKMKISSRSQIVDKALELGMLEIIPKGSVLAGLAKNPAYWKDFLSST